MPTQEKRRNAEQEADSGEGIKMTNDKLQITPVSILWVPDGQEW